ncbi:MAG: bifunctional phosphoglucose/phosphomannose isomerase [Candidatus Omnitrophica bacterium]|nr:bifunctional phosphoglucose/phosphomannose isomerase [Candidatus Omnitrophota bacterium]
MRLLDHPERFARLDPSGMLERARALPGECLEGWCRGLEWKVPSAWGRACGLVVLGMGGSAIGAELMQGWLGDDLPRPVHVNRAYTIPRWVGKGSLVLACSYSGNTEETLSGAEAARRRGARTLAITSGGKLARWARRHGLPLLLIPAGLPPRSAVGYLTFAPLGMLARLGWVAGRRVPVERACRGLESFIASELAPEVRASANPAKSIAEALQGRLPVLYGAAGGWEGITYRWRTQIEENAKSLCSHHIFPEATHNELSAWLHPRPLMRRSTALFLADPSVHPRTLRRMEFTRGIVRAAGARALTVGVRGATVQERMLKMIALGDFASVYLAFLYRVDPTPVERVEALKRFMKR